MIVEDYKKGYHNVGCGADVTITESEVAEILTSLTNFKHLAKLENGSYEVKPLGGILRNVDSSKAEYLLDFWYGKIPLGGEVERKFRFVG